MMKGETLLIWGHGVIGQGQLCPLARGCHALRCLVIFQSKKEVSLSEVLALFN